MLDTLVKLYGEGASIERCGFLLKDGTLVEVPNVHSEPEKGFDMDSAAMIEHLEKPLVATWHTHPGGDPNLSQEDYAGFLNWPHLKHYIVGTRDGEVTVECYIVEDGLVIRCD
ncbi:Mov34/MPN/PAD-1 family protein [Sphingopyxis indica]|uniref:Mov34/MPN/PAD-1 family protein n=1 Tax=Sphingopyxis indica TaxID=436663 RepID=UPI002938E92C|nr:Mov34/MPN/PAD-1 family protein [Sphingopyxis indica]WOF44373.1 Mov34/MPN/PAD-1 family protein [Sphingopyxis indica]